MPYRDSYSESDIPGTHEYNQKEDEQRYGSMSYIEDGYVKSTRFCRKCGSIDIGISRVGRPYCKKVCRKKK